MNNLFVSWSSQLGSSQFLILKGNKMPFLHQHTSYCKPTCISVYLKWFGKSRNLKTCEVEGFFFNTLHAFSCSSRHLDAISFLRRLMRGLANVENLVMNSQ
jgi:hypothetical protein